VIKDNFNQWPLWLPALALAAVPFGRSVEVFVLIMALIGLSDLIRNHEQLLKKNAFKLFSVVFLLFWIPALLSSLDAVNMQRTITSVAGMLRFYLVGVFIVSRFDVQKMHEKLSLLLSIIVIFWAVDAWIQVIVGVDLFNIPVDLIKKGGRISGIFGENARLGLMIIPFFSITLFSIHKKFGSIPTLAVGLVLISAILLSGDRASWVSLSVTLFILAVIFGRSLIKLPIKTMIMSFTGLLLIVLSVVSLPQFQKRIASVAIGFDGSYSAVNQASSGRLPLWSTAIEMFKANPMNGVGVRSFRYAYPDYADENNPWVDFSLPREKQTGQTHAHQVVLEFATDTGVLGLIGYAIILWIIYINLLPLSSQLRLMVPLGYLISLAVIFFPVNTHQSFFSSHWGQIVWMMIALAISSLTTSLGNEKLSLFKRYKKA